ncbi:MAG: uncharacterized protein QOH88_1198 [Verrucomicrobiota bacterium]|jgi:fermentation-respiration switch protein FrsA (DUF1100 family)
MQSISLPLAIPGFNVPAALTLPDAEIQGAVLLIPGSLFSDVDGNFPVWQSFPRVYAHLAEGLARHGLASLRFAKLGPGTGSQEVDPTLAATSRTWAGRHRTARLALDLLRTELQRRGWERLKVAIAGHSEGAVVASVLARDGVEADGIVLLSGPSVGILDIMLEQNRAMPNASEEQIHTLEEVVALIRRGEPIPNALKERAAGPTGAGALVTFPPDALTYMREVDATDPVAAIAHYEKPVLIVQGGADDSVPPHHAEALRAARANRPTECAFFAELQHCYKKVPPNTPSTQSFGWPGPTDPRIDEAIAAWMECL